MNPTHTPTEPGWFYWASSTTNGKWYCEYINQTPAGKLFVQSTLSDVDTTGGFWGGKVPEPGETFTIPEISAWACEHNPSQINDPNDGIAATTQRNKEKR